MRRISIAAALLLTVGTANADPCAMVDKDQATWAAKHIDASPKIATWCVACGDKAPRMAAKPTAVRAIANKTGAWEVLVGGKGIDLAEVYVQTGVKTFANVGRLVGCSNTGAPFVDLAPPPCPPPPAATACAHGTSAPVRDAITGCVRDHVCPP